MKATLIINDQNIPITEEEAIEIYEGGCISGTIGLDRTLEPVKDNLQKLHAIPFTFSFADRSIDQGELTIVRIRETEEIIGTHTYYTRLACK